MSAATKAFFLSQSFTKTTLEYVSICIGPDEVDRLLGVIECH
jgi:hypothetical protein